MKEIRMIMIVNKLQDKAEPQHKVVLWETEWIVRQNGWVADWIYVLELLLVLR